MLKTFSIESQFVHSGEYRFNASSYAEGAISAMAVIERTPYKKICIGDGVDRAFHPTENQARSNFKRIWVDDEIYGIPFLSGHELFYFRPEKKRFLSKKMEKLRDLEVSPRTILVSRSGTTGQSVLVGHRLAQYAITDDAIRLVEGKIPIGYIYAFLSSRYGKVLLTKNEYGATVSHLEARHIQQIPLPLFDDESIEEIDKLIQKSVELRDEANTFFDLAEDEIHRVLGIETFELTDIEYFEGVNEPRIFIVNSSELGDRVDASNHLPIKKSILKILNQGNYPLTQLGELCNKITIPPRFKRNYSESEIGVKYLLPSQLETFKDFGVKRIALSQAKDCPEYLLNGGDLLLTTDGTVGRVHLVTDRITGWFGSNNIARLNDDLTNMGFIYAYLSANIGYYQLTTDIYGGVVDHINKEHIQEVLIPVVPKDEQQRIGDIVARAFELKDEAILLEEMAIGEVEMRLDEYHI